jgi:hypothetical protein
LPHIVVARHLPRLSFDDVDIAHRFAQESVFRIADKIELEFLYASLCEPGFYSIASARLTVTATISTPCERRLWAIEFRSASCDLHGGYQLPRKKYRTVNAATDDVAIRRESQTDLC